VGCEKEYAEGKISQVNARRRQKEEGRRKEARRKEERRSNKILDFRN
jgi:hypothetical protein